MFYAWRAVINYDGCWILRARERVLFARAEHAANHSTGPLSLIRTVLLLSS